ncbi:MAG: metal ABC transporter substrate-binding protein [Planctomycetota bacterium]|nr:metal ABC transporter substrate-binding protein [Planctomycetota bacterium]
MRHRRLRDLLCYGLLVLPAACGGDTKTTAPRAREKPLVFVVNYPLKYFAERIGGAEVEVRFPVPGDIDPAFWKPSDEDIAAFQTADVILLNGANYAKWLSYSSLPASRCVVTFRGQPIAIEDAAAHKHGPRGKHDHGATAFTTWLDLQEAIAQARAVKDALLRFAPDADKRFESLKRDLDRLDRKLVENAPKVPLVASHPVYRYLTRRYGLSVESVHFEPDEVPDEEGWKELEAILRRHPAKWMLWEDDPRAETKARLERLGVRSVVYAACANVPRSDDFLAVLRKNVNALTSIR